MDDWGNSLRVGIIGRGRIGGALCDLFTDVGLDAVAIDIGDDWDALVGRPVIVEAITEDLSAKRTVIGSAQRSLEPVAVLSTTSSLTARALGAGLPSPDRVLVWHPFNPVNRRHLIELAGAPATASQQAAMARQAAHTLAKATGRQVLEVADSPGMVVNRIVKRWTHAGLAALDQGWSPASVDAAFLTAGFRMGPIAVVRLVDPSVSLAVSGNFALTLGSRFAAPASLVAAAADPVVLQGDGRTSDAGEVVASALLQVRDEIDRVLVEGLVAGGPSAVRGALRSGAGWPDAVLDQVHSW